MSLATLATRGSMRMGRSSMSGLRVTVFGSSGFLGRYVVSHLGGVGCQMVLPYRGDEVYMRHLKLMGDLGAINFVKGTIRNLKDIQTAVADSDVVVNLLGIRAETRRWSFSDCHVSFPAVLAEVCAEQGVDRLIHVSALGASTDSDSAWLRSKAVGEVAVKEGFPSVTIMRPATVFGDEDKFLNRKAIFARHLPFFPLVDGGEAKAQPVYVDDVAKSIVAAINDTSSAGKTYSLAGPKTYAQKELAEFVFRAIGDEPVTISTPKSVALAGATISGLIPSPWMTADQIRLECINTTMEFEPVASLTATDLGVKVNPMEELAARYLFMYKKKSPFVDDGVFIKEPQ